QVRITNIASLRTDRLCPPRQPRRIGGSHVLSFIQASSRSYIRLLTSRQAGEQGAALSEDKIYFVDSAEPSIRITASSFLHWSRVGSRFFPSPNSNALSGVAVLRNINYRHGNI